MSNHPRRDHTGFRSNRARHRAETRHRRHEEKLRLSDSREILAVVEALPESYMGDVCSVDHVPCELHAHLHPGIGPCTNLATTFVELLPGDIETQYGICCDSHTVQRIGMLGMSLGPGFYDNVRTGVEQWLNSDRSKALVLYTYGREAA